jgi:uncharacterized protein (DUF58 family)
MAGFVPFLVLLFIIASFLRVDVFFTVVYLLLAVYILSRLWTRRAVVQLCAERRFTARAFPGEQVAVELSVRNDGWLPVPWVEIHESLPVQLVAPPFYREVISLGPHEERRFTYQLTCRRRGYHPLGPLTMRTGDLLGIMPQSVAQVESDHIIIYPQVVPLQALDLPTRSPHAALPATSHLFEDPTRLMGVRDYRRGDSLRRIHWTATASVGRLLVKQYQPAIARETVACLDLGEEGYERRQRYTATELAIVAAASIANHVIVQEGLPAGLMTEALDPLSETKARFFLPPRAERAHLMSLLEVLARVQVAPDSSFVDLLRRESVKLSWGTTLAVITGRQTEALLDTLVYLRHAGFAVALILVQPGRQSVELGGRANLLGVPVHQVWNQRDLEAWR